MAKVFVNEKLDLSKKDCIWYAKNGSTRLSLKIINTIEGEKSDVFNAKLGTLETNRTAYIFINPEKKADNRILGLYLNESYGYKVIEGKELFTASSVGGYGNSESKFGIYEIGTVIKEFTYKNRTPASYYRLTDQGWVELLDYEAEKEKIIEI